MTSAQSIDAPHRAAAAVTALLLLLAALVCGAATARPAGASTIENTFSSKINQARSANGLPRFSVRSDLAAVAQRQAARMAGRNSLYHNPNLTRDVKNWRWVGENVGYGPDSTSLHQAFMHSAPHRANILDRDFTEVGIGVVVRAGRVWVAEVFRRPARASVSSTASFRHTLHFGSQGGAVQRVQHRLGLRSTGWYGADTRRAVASFQRHQGWRGRGNVGPKTWHRLF